MNDKKAVFSERPVALVTGAARGIGRACAAGLGRAGFNVALNDRPGEEERSLLEKAAKDVEAHGGESLILPCDIAGLEAHGAMLDAIRERWERLDCLVNNAGVSVKRRGDILDVEPDSFDRCIDINAKAVFFLIQRVARWMIEQDVIGRQHRSIVNITSCNAAAVSITRAEYCVSKSAASMVSRLFGLRLADEGIGVYEIRPGMIETDMTTSVKSRYASMIDGGFVPMRRWGQPEDIATTVVAMAEGRLPYTVGQVINADGGLTIVSF